MEEMKKRTEVMVEDQPETNDAEMSMEELEELEPIEAEVNKSKRKLNGGAVAIIGLAIGGAAYGVAKIVKRVKNCKAEKRKEGYEEDFISEDAEAVCVEEKPEIVEDETEGDQEPTAPKKKTEESEEKTE